MSISRRVAIRELDVATSASKRLVPYGLYRYWSNLRNVELQEKARNRQRYENNYYIAK